MRKERAGVGETDVPVSAPNEQAIAEAVLHGELQGLAPLRVQRLVLDLCLRSTPTHAQSEERVAGSVAVARRERPASDAVHSEHAGDLGQRRQLRQWRQRRSAGRGAHVRGGRRVPAGRHRLLLLLLCCCSGGRLRDRRGNGSVGGGERAEDRVDAGARSCGPQRRHHAGEL